MGWRLLSEKQLEKIIEQRVEEARREDETGYEKEMLLKQANLSALQSQINPHFLYNSLECIRGMALMEEQEDIASLAQSLSKFFRYSISGKRNIVTLRDELDHVYSYVQVQKYRFGGRFRLEMEDMLEYEKVLLPKLTLQPVVENAILHGLKDTMRGGIIRISAEAVSDGPLLVKIEDNGCGMTPETLYELTRKILYGDSITESNEHHTGIGMQNVDRRLKLYFGQDYGMTIYSTENTGTEVDLRIPNQTGEQL